MKIGVFHMGLQHSWQTALAFQEGGSLGWFATTLFYNSDVWPYKAERFLPGPIRRIVSPELRRRSSDLIDPAVLRLFGRMEWAEVMLQRIGKKQAGRKLLNRSRSYFAGNVISLLQKEPVDIIWGFNGFSRDVFRWAKAQGITCVLDQTIGHYRAQQMMLRLEREKFPQYFLNEAITATDEFIDYQQEELQLADIVVCGSTFVEDTLTQNAVDPQKIRVLPYGYEESEFSYPSVRLARDREPTFLFIGQIHPRKGAHYILEAAKRLSKCAPPIRLIGHNYLPTDALAGVGDRIEMLGHVPRLKVPEVMTDADCFLFPSLFEGSALVLYEALGSGMPRIYSKMSGHGPAAGTGLQLNSVTIDSVLEAIDAVRQNPSIVEEWSRAALAARKDFTWKSYRKRARALVSSPLT